MFELQMFGVEIEGIDEDILAEISDETEEPEVEETQESTEEPEEPTVDADNENKQVEVQEEIAEEGAPVPYARFKQVY